jgi:hypothetical protein
MKNKYYILVILNRLVIYKMSSSIELPNNEFELLPYAISLSDYEIQNARSTLLKLKKAKNLVKPRENFASVDSENQFTLSERTTPDVNTFIPPFNDAIGLLDDPFDRKKIAFDMYVKLQNDKLASLNDQLTTLEAKAKVPVNNSNVIKSIKNSSTSLLFNVDEYNSSGKSTSNYKSSVPSPKPTTSNSTTCSPINNSKSNYYLVYGNNGCLAYDTNAKRSTPYYFAPCDSNDIKQKFYINNVKDVCSYNNFMINDVDKISKDISVKLPFNVVTPASDIKQCLTAQPDSITIQPCTLDNSQKFQEFYKPILY